MPIRKLPPKMTMIASSSIGAVNCKIRISAAGYTDASATSRKTKVVPRPRNH
jgi:hypothetical protein